MVGALASTGARVAGGIGLVACAAIVALAAGGGGFLGGLGGLFGSRDSGLQVARSTPVSADIVAAPAHSAPRAVIDAVPVTRATPPRPSSRAHRTPTRRPAAVPSPTPAPSPNPAPSTPPAPVTPPSPPAPVPTPGHGQVVTAVGNTVKQVVSQAPAAVQPLAQPLDQTVDTLVKVCTNLPVCP